MFGGNFAPVGWAMCNGQLLSISEYSTLYAVIGTAYGGNGTTTFALPNLISRLPVSIGQGAGLSLYQIGQSGGVTDVTLTVANMPSHTHLLTATTVNATSPTVGGGVMPAVPTYDRAHLYSSTPSGQPQMPLVNFAAGVVANAGSNLPHPNMMPSLCVTFIIALEGVFPSRN
jgi:microcystin-dependent protein